MTGLVGWWPLHRINADAVDLSGNGNDGTISGAVRGVAGRGGLQAYSFDNTDDYINIGTAYDPTGENSFTLSAWAKWDGNDGNVDILHLGSFETIIFVNNSQQWATYIHDGTDAHIPSTSYTASADVWRHIAGVYNGTDLILYVDAVEEASESSPSPRDNGTGGYIGAKDSTTRHWGGQICDVRIYDRALSSAEITRLYEWGSLDIAEPPDNDDNGVSYWTLDESSGDAIDSWGSNDGTVTGATQGVTGVRGTAYSFDGTDDEVTASGPETTIEGTSSVTLTAWANATVLPTGTEDQNQMVNAGDGAFLVADGDEWAYGVQTDSYYSIRFTDRFETGTWVFHALTYDGTTLRAYQNAELQDALSVSGNISHENSTTAIGASHISDRFWDGSVDDVRIYNEALDAAELHDVYRYGTRGRDLRAETVIA